MSCIRRTEATSTASAPTGAAPPPNSEARLTHPIGRRGLRAVQDQVRAGGRQEQAIARAPREELDLGVCLALVGFEAQGQLTEALLDLGIGGTRMPAEIVARRGRQQGPIFQAVEGP